MYIMDHYFSEMKASDSLKRKLPCCYDIESGRIMILKTLKIPEILSIRKGNGCVRVACFTHLKCLNKFTFA